MKQIVLDFETYYDADYSLRKMTPVQYILDPRFEMIGCAVKEGDGKSFWLTHDGLKRYLAGLPPRVVVVSHNALFDMCILAWRYDYTPTLMIDTLGMARAWVGHKMRSLALASLATYLGLGAKGGTVHKVVGMRLADIKAAGFYDEYATYSCNDADLCWGIYRLFVSQGFPASEIAVMDTVLRCATEPKFVLDQTALAEHLHNTLMEKERLLSTIGVDNRDDLMSNDRFAECLRSLGVEPPTKISLTTGKETYAFAKTDQDFMDLEEHENPQVQMLVAARLGVKSTIEETRTQRLIEISHLTWPGNHSGQSGLLPMALRYSGAHTHRLCLVGDTVIAVLRGGCILTIPLTDLLPQDYVWDGEEFVQHGGVSYAGIKAVITYDGITGTTDHRVLTALAGYCPLRVARDLGIPIVRGAAPDANRINTTARPVRPPTTTDKDADGESVPGFRGVYDIIDCGPRNRFMANGRIVHNSGEWKLNMQNLPARGNSKIREAIRAPSGHKVVAVDASQIEARMAAWFCGAWDMVNAFAAKEDVYSSFASTVYGYEVLKKSHPVERFIGKTCLSAGSAVVTDRGLVPIERVTPSHRLWDGEEWVCHHGVVSNGLKKTLPLCGLWLTPDHLVLCGTQWKDAASLYADRNTLSRALATAAATLPSQATCAAPGGSGFQRSLWRAIAGALSSLSSGITSAPSRVHGAPHAGMRPGARSGIGSTQMLCRMTPTGGACSTASPPRAHAATIRKQVGIARMAPEGYMSTPTGGRTGRSSCGMFRPFPDGTTRLLRWIGSTMTGVTSRVTSGFPPAGRTSPTAEMLTSSQPTCAPSKTGSANSKRYCQVYDLANAGPRNRFTVMTDAGPLIVHNCILGLQYNLGWPRFQKSVAMSSKAQVGQEVVLSDEEAAKVVATYRSTYHPIPAMWRRLQSMIPRMTGNLNETIGPVTFVKGGVKLPSGLFLHYHGLENKEGQWWFTYGGKPKYIYGGKMLENIIQALARICVMDAAVRVRKRLEALGLGAIQLNLQVHDELVYIVPDGHVDQVTAIVMEEMIRRPSWGTDIPLDAEAGCGQSYGDAK